MTASNLLFTQSSSNISAPIESHTSESGSKSTSKSIDDKLFMRRLRNNFTQPGSGLQLGKNRQDLVAEFYDLSRSVVCGDVSTEEFESSRTLQELEEQLDLNIDLMSNAQIVNILASLIKMKVNPSLKVVKLLEHEIKFRMSTLTVAQVTKLIRFYNSTETSFEQKQITDMLNNIIRSCLSGEASSLRDLVDVYKMLTSHQVKSSMLSLAEERLLSLLTSLEDDDIVSQCLPRPPLHDYVSLCELFIELASVGRRPTPLLKAATKILLNTQLPPKENEDGPNISLMLSTLNSFVNLNYINKPLTSKLITDFIEIVDINEIDSNTICNVLRTLGGLKWLSEDLLSRIYKYAQENQGDISKVDHNLIMTLIHVTAQLNFKPKLDLKKFYNDCMNEDRLKLVDKSSRKWLNHVWSLALLDIADGSHLKSVLNSNFIEGLGTKSSHTDTLKLLNLRAISKFEFNLNALEDDCLTEFMKQKIQRGADMQKYAAKIKEALTGLVSDENNLRLDVHTPFGFIADCELLVDKDMNFLPLNSGAQLEDTIKLHEKEGKLEKDSWGNDKHKCVLINILFNESISNSSREPLGHKQIVAKILSSLGYKTIFLPEGVLGREKTSADLTNRIREMIAAAIVH